MKWLKDPKVEANLFRPLGIKFEVETIPLSCIDLNEGLRHQVRLAGKLNDDVTSRYWEAMEKPDAAFPMTVLQKEKKRYWPWSGNHRLAAASFAGLEMVDAYVVEIHEPVMQDLFPRKVNLIEAVVGMTTEEAIINARFMVEKHRMSVVDAAKEFGLKKEQVYKSQRIEEVKQEIEKMGVNSSGFTPSLLNRLHAIQGGVILRRTTSLLNKYKVKGKEADQLVIEVRKGQETSEAAATVCLEKWESALEARKTSSAKKKASGTTTLPYREVQREQLFRLVTGLARFVESNQTTSQAQITDPAHLEFVQRNWKVIKEGMSKLLGKE